jgi:hypothetical protein
LGKEEIMDTAILIIIGIMFCGIILAACAE